jgi:glyoxalase/bleomycin resistance protein/dioxygenase superfamily protein
MRDSPQPDSLAAALTRLSNNVPMSKPSELSSIAQPVAELPVLDVERAQAHYCNALGFEIAWTWPDGSVGAVSRGDAAIFLRRREPPFDPVTLWIFALDVEATLDELTHLDANVVEPLEKKPWNLMQFTVEDIDGHRLNFHHDVPGGRGGT